MKRRVTERVLVLILSIALLLSSTGIYTVFATQENTAGSQTVTESSTVADASETPTVTDSQENIVEGGGAIEVPALSGEGTASKPYLVADVDDLFLMQEAINDSTKKDKYFCLTADIDLSGVTTADLAKNPVMPGTLVSLDKSLSDATPKSVWFSFNGNGHKIYGLDVTSGEFSSVAVFGYISSNSTIKNLVVDSCRVTVNNDKATNVSVLAVVNDGSVRNSTFSNIMLNVKSADKNAVAGAIVAKNSGYLSDITAENINVNVSCNINSAGAITGANNSVISKVKATGVSVTTSESKVTTNVGAVAGLNNSRILDCVVSTSKIAYGQFVGGVAGVNSGEINNVSVSASGSNEETVSKSEANIISNGYFGGVAGKNCGKIKAVTVLNVGAYIIDGGVYGGVAGLIAKDAVVYSSVATGVANGKGISGGIAGKTEENVAVKNCYAFVKLNADVAHGAVIGEGEAYVENNFWSSEITGRFVAYDSGSKQGDIVRSTRLITINAGETEKISISELGGTYGSVNIVADSISNINLSGNGVKLEKGDKDFTLKATVANKTAELTYSAKISVNAGYNNATVISRDLDVAVITLDKDAKGNGLTAETPVAIKTSTELGFLRVAPFAYFELAGDVDMPENWVAFPFSGYLNGAGFTLNADAPLFSGITGSVKNLNVKLNSEIRTAVFGDANSAVFDNVRLTKGQLDEGSKDVIRLLADRSGVAPFVNRLMGNTVVNGSYSEIPVHVSEKNVKNVAGFVALVDADGANITSSGASVSITSDFEEKINESAAFIGKVENNADGTINGCFATLDSKVVDFAIIGSGNKDKFKAEGNYVSFGTDKICPAEFDNVTASQWLFDAGSQGFIAGKGSVVSISAPAEIALFNNAEAEDFVAVYDSTKLKVNTNGITVKNGIIYLPVEAAEGVVTVLNSEVTLIHKPTGLKSTIGVSNGLEKDVDGKYIIYYAVDIAFIGENLEKFGKESFKLANDIDMSGLTDFKSVGGTAFAFSGNFDGCGHTISGFTLDGTSKAGLFGTLENATVSNLVIDGAEVSASGSYAGVLAGQLRGNTTIKSVTIKNAEVSSAESYAGVLAGSVNGEDIVVSKVSVNGAKVSALNYAGGVAGYVEGSLNVSDVLISDADVTATSFGGGIAGYANALNANAVKVRKSTVTADKTAGGIAGVFAGEIKSSQINDSVVTGDIAGGIVGSTISGESAVITNSRISSMTIDAVENAKASAGFVAVVVDDSSATISDGLVTGGVSVKASMASGGFIGDVKGEAVVNNSASYANITGYKSSTKAPVGAGGVIGKVSCDNFADVSINNVNVGGRISAYDFAGGIIGNVLSENGGVNAVSSCVVGATVSAVQGENSALIIGGIKQDVAEASVDGVVISTYGAALGAYTFGAGESTYTDLDKHVTSSLDGVIRSSDELTVDVNNSKANELGFTFDEVAGWQSESDERVTVVSSTENSVVIIANKSSDCSIVATYKLAADNNIALKVHFDVAADIRLSLDGSGTKEDPYRISDGFELDAVRDYMGEGVFFVLVNDINFAESDFAFGGNFYNKGACFEPLGSDEAPFIGTFDGNGYSINGICVNAENASVFGTVQNAEIKNIKLDVKAEGSSLAAAVATKVAGSVVRDVEVSGAVTVTAENSSVAGVVAFASSSEFENIIINNLTVSTPEIVSGVAVVYASAVVARAVDTSVTNIETNSTEISSAGYAGALVGYAENVTVKNAVITAEASGDFVGGVFATVDSQVTVEGISIAGEIVAKSSAAGIAGVANGVIRATDVVVSASLECEVVGIVAGYAEKDIYSQENSDIRFSNIIYSSYTNTSAVFGEAELNSYQLSEYADAFIDVNEISPVDGDFIAVGKDAVSVKDAVKLLFNATGDASAFSIGSVDFTLIQAYSQPEGLVEYSSGSVTAKATQLEEADLVLRYSNGIETSVKMISVVGMSGEGTQENPYLITNEDTMLVLSLYPSAEFALANDVSLSKDWTPISAFSGKIDGNGFRLTGLNVKADNAGLFEVVTDSAEIRNIEFSSANVEGVAAAGVVASTVNSAAKFENIIVSDSIVKADDCAGAIAGIVNSSSVEINSCSVSGSGIEAKNAAGLVGVAQGNGLSISKCSVSADVSGENASAIVCVAESDIAITDSIALGTIKGEYAESGIIAVVANEPGGDMLVSGNEVSTALSGEAQYSASVVGVFEVLPEDDETFAGMFNNNTVTNGVDSFQREVMQYQNFDGAEIPPEEEILLNGEGTQAKPYEIYTVADLNAIPDGSDDYFVMMNDIIITEADYGVTVDEQGNSVHGVLYGGYTPIKAFAGTFDGKGHVISGLYIDTDEDYVGLFGDITATGSVKNVHLEILDESQGCGFSGIRGGAFVGGVAGYSESVDGIINCSVEGGSISGVRSTGAVVGQLSSSKLVNCVSMTNVVSEKEAGGLVGTTKGNCSVENSISATTIDCVGGTIVGINEGKLNISGVLSTGSSKGTNSITVGKNENEITIEKSIIGGTNAGAVLSSVDAQSVNYVYSDVTTLGTDEDGVMSVSAGNLMASVPEGLDGWNLTEGCYPAPAMDDSYMQSLVKIAALPVIADVKEGKDVVDGFKYPVSVGTEGMTLETSIKSGADDLYIEGYRVYNDIFTGETPYIIVTCGDFTRRIVLPQKNDENTLYLSLAKHFKALAAPQGKYEVLSDYLDNENAKIVLTADIDFMAGATNENNAISPIVGYTGSFDGNGYSVRNMRVSANEGATGLFATVGGTSRSVAEFKNITFDNAYITGFSESGVLAGAINEYTAIENIRIENSGKASFVSGSTAGALAGSMAGGTVKQVYSDITVEGDVAVGGLVGRSSATITESNTYGKVSCVISDSELAGVGGFVGVLEAGAVYTSSSLANVIVSSIENATSVDSVAGIGGFVGVANGDGITESFSAGSVKVSGAQISDGKSVVGIGGFAGVSYCDVESVYSASAVTADFVGTAEDESLRAIGGLVGVAYGNVEDSYASGGVSATRTGVKLFGSDCFAGGVVGYVFGDSYENLYFDKYMNNDENLNAVSNIISESCYRLETNKLVSDSGLSSAFAFGVNSYPYLKSMLNNKDSKLSTALSVVITTPDADDLSVKNGAGVSSSVALPSEVTIGSDTYSLEWTAGENAAITDQIAELNRSKLYAEYMSLFVGIDGVTRSYDRLYNDIGTTEATLGNTNIEYSIKNESGRDYMNKSLIGILIKSRLEDNSVVTSDIFTTCDSDTVKMNKLLVTSGGFYIDAIIESGYDIEVVAKDLAGNTISVSDAGAQGKFVETANANSVVLEVTLVKKDIPWGLTSLWENIVR